MEAVRVVEGTRTSVELPKASVDVAFVCDVYHHFESPEASLASLFEAIRPGGSLVIIEFHRIPGQTPEWLLEHVRAGQDVFTAEIEAAGFVETDEIELEGLTDNYIKVQFDGDDALLGGRARLRLEGLDGAESLGRLA